MAHRRNNFDTEYKQQLNQMRRSRKKIRELNIRCLSPYRLVFLLQGSRRWVHLCIRLQGKCLLDKNQPTTHSAPHIRVIDVATFCTWLISSCLRFWFRVIFLSGCSPKSPTPPISVLFLTASFTVLVSASRALPTHSSSRLLTGQRREI